MEKETAVRIKAEEKYLGKAHFLTVVSFGPRTKNQHGGAM